MVRRSRCFGLPPGTRRLSLKLCMAKSAVPHPYHRRHRGAPDLQAADSPVGLHEREDREALHNDSQGLRASARAGEHYKRGCDGPHAASHRTVTHDRARPRRLHGDVDLRSLVHTHARALHASDARTPYRRAETFNLSTRCPQNAVQQKEAAEAASFAKKIGGRQEARTPDLRVANAALSQLS
jgi:hypothetical protein